MTVVKNVKAHMELCIGGEAVEKLNLQSNHLIDITPCGNNRILIRAIKGEDTGKLKHNLAREVGEKILERLPININSHVFYDKVTDDISITKLAVEVYLEKE